MKNIWVPISGQIAQQRKVETLANNIANINTPGFKKDQVTFKEHLTALSKGVDDSDIPRKEWAPEHFYHTHGAENSYVKIDGTHTNFEQGALKPTGNPLDLALNGKGFFEVLTPSGIRYTRNGIFSLNQAGELVTSSGYKLLSPLSVDGERQAPADDAISQRILRLPTNTRISISKEGGIYSRDGKLADISVVEFNDIHALRKEGNSLFQANDLKNIKRAQIETTVNQGFIEGSNVNAIKEMSELINAHRQFENIQKAIHAYDAVAGKSVTDIANF